MTASSYEKIADGLAIYKPKKSPFWWCRVRIDNHPGLKELRKSLKTEDRYEAIFRAKSMVQEAKIKQEHGIDLLDRKPYIHQLIPRTVKTIRDKRPFKHNYKVYIRFLENHFLPYFTKHKTRVDELTRFVVEDYFKANADIHQSQTQINNTKTSFKYLFEQAIREGFMQERDVPAMPRVKRGSEKAVRDFFSAEELATILHTYREFIEASRKAVTAENRFLMMLNSFFLIGSGARPGSEVQTLRWRDLEIIEKDGVEILTAVIRKGKTGYKQRRIVLDQDAFLALQWAIRYSIHKEPVSEILDSLYIATFHPPTTKNPDIFDVLKDIKKHHADRIIFDRLDGKTVEFNKPFERYLKFLLDKKYIDSVRNFTPYSFRHSYITMKLLNHEGAEKWTVEQVARQVGNSLQMIDDYYLKLESVDKAFNFAYYHKLRQQKLEEKMSSGES